MSITAIKTLVQSDTYTIDLDAVAAALLRRSHDVLEARQGHRPAVLAQHEPRRAGRHVAHPGHPRDLRA